MSGPAQHTPGPWRVEGPDLHDQYEIIGPDAAGLGFGEAIASVAGGLGDVGSNARLIAQAPALADAILKAGREVARPAHTPDFRIMNLASTSRVLWAETLDRDRMLELYRASYRRCLARLRRLLEDERSARAEGMRS